MSAGPPAYGLWSLVVINTAVFAIFAFNFARPRTALQRRYPGLDLISHDAGHLWETLLGWRGDPHLNPLYLFSNVLLVAGFMLLASAWRVLLAAQQARRLATTGPYVHLRHPQSAGFLLIMIGFLLQWPTVLTLAMFPILV